MITERPTVLERRCCTTHMDDDVLGKNVAHSGSTSSTACPTGIVPGSLVLLGREPGIGKSTLLLQASAHFAREVGPVLYPWGEESEHQIKSRGDRLGEAPLLL